MIQDKGLTINQKLMVIAGIGMIAIGVNRNTSTFLELIKTSIIFIFGILLVWWNINGTR